MTITLGPNGSQAGTDISILTDMTTTTNYPTPELKYINYSCRPLYLYAYTISDIIDAS